LQSNDTTLTNRYTRINRQHFWLGVHGMPVLFWKGISGFEIPLLSILCMLIARMEMGTTRVSGDSDNREVAKSTQTSTPNVKTTF